METEKKSSRRGLYIGIAVVVAFVAIVAGSIVWALGRGDSGGQDAKAIRSAYESAMRKAGVTAPYPTGPVELTSVVPSGAHPFSATFTAGEIAALLSTFPLTIDVDGTSVALRTVDMSFPESGTVALRTRVSVQDKTYSAVVVAPVVYQDGVIRSPGATKATAEGFTLSESQRAQLTRAVITYVNEYLSSAPGLTIDTAEITDDGLEVTGTAPNSLEFRP